MRGKLLGPATVYLTTNVANAAIPFLLLPVLPRVLFGRVWLRGQLRRR